MIICFLRAYNESKKQIVKKLAKKRKKIKTKEEKISLPFFEGTLIT
jgi:hypothetical protein